MCINYSRKKWPLPNEFPSFKWQSYYNLLTHHTQHTQSRALLLLQVVKYCTFTVTNAVTGNFTLPRPSRGGWVSFLRHCSSYSFFITLCFPLHLLRLFQSKTRLKSQSDNALHSVTKYVMQDTAHLIMQILLTLMQNICRYHTTSISSRL